MLGEFERDLRAMMHEKGIDVDGPVDPAILLTIAARQQEFLEKYPPDYYRMVLDKGEKWTPCTLCDAEFSRTLRVFESWNGGSLPPWRMHAVCFNCAYDLGAEV